MTVSHSNHRPAPAIKALALGLLLGTGMAAASTAEAAIQFFDAKTAFITATGAAATAPFPDLGPSTAQGATTFGDLTYSSPTSANLFFANFSARIAGNEIAISGVSNLDVALANPVFALGFDFVEPEFDPNLAAAFVDSTFDVGLFNGATPVGSFSFNAPEDALYFAGVWSDTAFNRIEIRETAGQAENEFFGQFYTGIAAADFTPPTILAGPPAFALFAFGLAGLGLLAAPARRRR